MLLTTILITAILAAFQFRITHSSFTHTTRSKLAKSRDLLQDGRHPWEQFESNLIEARNLQLSLLEPRVIGTLPIPNHWTVALDSFNSFLDGAPAFDVFANFYAAIEAHAAALQTQVTQLPAVAFQLGDIELVFFSAIGNVPWSLVQNFAVLMQGVNARGIAGFFQARAVHLSGVTVFVDLRLI